MWAKVLDNTRLFISHNRDVSVEAANTRSSAGPNIALQRGFGYFL